MRHTVRAIIIRNKSVLLVTGHDADFYWTPGGGVEQGETTIDALHREIREELTVAVSSYEPYYSYEYKDQKVDNFLVEIEGEIYPGNEITNIAWHSLANPVKTSSGFNEMVMPKLIQDGIV